MIFLLMSHDLRDLKKVLFGQLLPKATTFKIHSTIQTENQATPSQSFSSKVMRRAHCLRDPTKIGQQALHVYSIANFVAS